MIATNGETQPLWAKAISAQPHVPLTHDIEAPVCIIGGGLAGLVTAYQLLQRGILSVVLEAREVGGGDTLRTTAHLASVLDDRFSTLIKVYGEDGARLARESHQWAIDEIERMCTTHGWTKAMFKKVDGYLFVGDKGKESDLRDELDAARRAGFGDIGIVDAKEAGVGWPMGNAIKFPNQGQYNMGGYLDALQEYLTHNGVKIYINSPVVKVDDGNQPIVVETQEGHKVTAQHLVVATNSPINTRVSMHTALAPYRTYVVAAVIPRNQVKTALYWDMEDPYHYVRTIPYNDQELLIIGGEDHKTGQETDPEQHLENLRRWAKAHFPMIESFDFAWSGQVLEPYDFLGYLGLMPGLDHTYVITGDSGHGMTHAHIGARIIADGITGQANPWADLYSPRRIKVSLDSAKEYITENLNVVAQMADWFTGGDLDKVENLGNGDGAVVRRGLTKVAVYRDEHGELHQMTAVCPHMGCIVHWNSLERSWDCPCHGSRFNAVGSCIQGPAVNGLAPIDEQQQRKAS